MGKRKPRMGRPPGSGLPPSQVRSERLVVMLTPPEADKLSRLAAKQELPLSTYAYQVFARTLSRLRG